jgi:RNA polymerase sigma-70 factor (ECF subfamily)
LPPRLRRCFCPAPSPPERTKKAGGDQVTFDATSAVTAVAAFRAIDTFAGTARLSTWLHRIVINAALMRLRSRRRRREESIDDLLPRFDEEGRWAEPVAAEETSTDGLLERRETRTMVRAAIERLPLNAVKTRLHRARQALRTLLHREFHDERSRSDGRVRQPA